MAQQIVLFIVLLACISVSWGQTCNWTSHEATRIQLKHETTMLDGWIDLAKGFVHAVAPKDLTALDKIGQYTKGNGNLEFKDVILDLMKMEAAFAACLFLGLIYFLTMGTGWSCFLCCRCCGNCGANKSQRQTKNISSRRCIYVVLTMVVLGFLVAAVTCAFLANEEIYRIVTKGKGSIQEVIDKVEVYVNNTQKEIKTLDGCFEDTKEDVISSASDEAIEQGLATQLKDEIQDQSAPILTSLTALDNDFKEVKKLKEKVEFVKKKEGSVIGLNNTIEELKNNCASSLDAECIEMNNLTASEFVEVKYNSFSEIPTKVDRVFNLEFRKELQNHINQIPKKIVKETKNPRQDIIEEIRSFKQNKELVEEIEKGVNDFHNETNDFEKKLNENFSKYVTSQEVYRYWGVFGLIMSVALPSGLLFLGLCCGLLGSKSGRYPSERSGLSDCGGCTMMASVYLMFILGSIAMLFTVAFFQVGGHVEAYGCRYLYEKDLKTVDKLLDIVLPNKSNSKFLEDLKSLKIGEIVNQCENDSAIYAAVPSLETMLNVQLTFDKEIDRIKFDGYEDKIIDMIIKAFNDLINDIEEFKNNLDIPALHELRIRSREKIIKADTAATVQVLKKLVNSSLGDRKRLSIEALKILQDLQEAAVKRDEITTTLGGNGEGIAKYETLVDNAMKGIQTEIGKISPIISESAKKMVKEYFDDILLQLKEFANEATETIKGKVGKCGTLYDAFSLARHFACREVLGPLNALWLSLGMCCFFFLFAIPFATKLSKHFFVMEEDEDYYIGMDSLHGQHINGYAEHQVPLHKGANNFSNGRQRPMHHQNGAYEPDLEERWTRY